MKAPADPVCVTAGGMRIDTIITRSGRAHLGLVGGNALYAAVGAAVWGSSVAAWAKIGENYPADWLRSVQKAGISIEGIVPVPGPQDHRTFYAYSPDGQRNDTDPASHFRRIGLALPQELEGYVHSTPGQDDPEDYGPLALQPGDWPARFGDVVAVHLAPLSLRTHLNVPAHLRRQGVRVVTADPGERYMTPALLPYVRRLLPDLDAFLPSEQELRSLLGEKRSMEEACRVLASWGAPLIIIKRGPAGALLYHGPSASFAEIPSYHRPDDPSVVDPTGAGDAFCGGFLQALASGHHHILAALYGAVSASLVIEGYGALFACGLSPSVAQKRLRVLEAAMRR